MLLRTIDKRLSPEPVSPLQHVHQLARVWITPSRICGHGLFVAICMVFTLNAAPVMAQENNPDQSDIIYEDVDPDGNTENNPDESDIRYEDFPMDDLPEGGAGNNPLPVDEGQPNAIPEPGMLALLLAGAAGAALMGRRRSRQS